MKVYVHLYNEECLIIPTCPVFVVCLYYLFHLLHYLPLCFCSFLDIMHSGHKIVTSLYNL